METFINRIPKKEENFIYNMKNIELLDTSNNEVEFKKINGLDDRNLVFTYLGNGKAKENTTNKKFNIIFNEQINNISLNEIINYPLVIIVDEHSIEKRICIINAEEAIKIQNYNNKYKNYITTKLDYIENKINNKNIKVLKKTLK